MNRILRSFIAFLILFQLCTAQLVSYDPTTGSATATVEKQDSVSYNWLFKRTITTPTASVSLESVRYDPTQTGNKKVVTYAAVTGTVVKAVSKKSTCAVIWDATSNAQVLGIVRFNSNNNDLVENLIATTRVTVANANTKTYEVADLCTALKIDGVVYHLDQTITTPGTSKYVADTLPTPLWTNPVFNYDFSYVAADEGLYKYDTNTKIYASVLPTTFYTNKQIWTTNEAVLVYSWRQSGTTNFIDNSFKAFSIPSTGTTHTLVGTITGNVYQSSPNEAPVISVSQSLRVALFYAKSGPTAYFVMGKIFNYKLNTQTTLTIPTWITNTKSSIIVSDQYLYARNLVDKTGVTPAVREHGAYFIIDGSLSTVYLAQTALVAADGTDTDLVKSRIFTSRSGELQIIRVYLTSTKVLTLQTKVYSPPASLQFFSWDKKSGVLTSSVTGAGTSFYRHPSKARWFLWSKATATNNKFQSVWTDPLNDNKLIATLTTSQNEVLKAVSPNYKCALIYDTVTPLLKTYEFSNAGVIFIFRQLTANLYSGIDLTQNTIKYDISDDCRGLRIENKIFHLDGITYVLDTYEGDRTQLANPVFSDDFSLAITDSGIFSYTPKSGSTAGIYKLDRAETFDGNKKIWKDGNNYIIGTYKQENNTQYSWKIQFNNIVNSVSTNFGQFTGTVSTVDNVPPNFLVSPKLSHIIVQGLSSTDATKASYFAKTIDWGYKRHKDIPLPSAVTNIIAEIALSDEFLYVKNIVTDKKHSAYALMGSKIFKMFDEVYPYPLDQYYERSIIIPDTTGNRKLVVASEYATDDYVRLFKDSRKSISEILNPNPLPTDQMTFSEDGYSLRQTQFPFFGKWVYTTDTGTTLKYIQYDPAATDKKKTIIKTGLIGDNTLIANSQNMDCIITFVDETDLGTVQIHTSNSSTTVTSAWADVVTSGDFTNSGLTWAISGRTVGAGSNCWAIRIENLAYFKKADGTGFTKSALIAGLAQAPSFDSSLNFAYSNGKVYKYSGSDYVEAFTVTGLKSTVELYSSGDLNKLMILSYQSSATGDGSDVVVRIYLNSGSWRNIDIPSYISSFTTVSFSPYAIFEPNLETFGVWYYGGELSALKPIIHLAKADYTANSLSLIQTPNDLIVTNVELIIQTFGNTLYVYLYQDSNNAFEYIYNIDKVNNKLIEIRKRKFTRNQINYVSNRKIFQQSGTLYALYQKLQPSGVSVVKNTIGSRSFQTTLKGIDTNGAGLIIQNGQVYVCPSGCSFCLNPNTCSNCMPGHVLDSNNNCLRCGPLCQTCSVSALSTCLTCVNGYYPSSGNCLQCSDNCLTCSSASTCTKCKVGMYKLGSSCVPCIDNCVSCNPATATAPLCDTCRKGYVYNSVTQTCVKCVVGCTRCDPTKVYECLKCDDGYESVMTNNVLTCVECPNNCKSCINGVCQTCRDGFRLFENNCVAQCKLPCKECSTTDPAKCASCVGGYTLSNQLCNPDLSCNTNKDCASCPLGYNLIAGECFQCNGGDNCRTCENTNVQKCASCNKGYYLTSTSTCQACKLTGCVACSSEIYCSECKPGYVLSGSIGEGKCVKCDDSCATCFDSPTNCDKCAPGFTKNGWNCINDNNIKINLKLGGTFSSFTTQDYDTIEHQICERVGRDRKNFNLLELKSGSIILAGSLDVDNSVQQETLTQDLQALLATGNAIGGFAIEQSTVVAITDGTVYTTTTTDDSEAKRYRDIAIIVGVVIPVGLIIIFIIFFILYKKGMICASTDTRVNDTALSDVNIKQK